MTSTAAYCGLGDRRATHRAGLPVIDPAACAVGGVLTVWVPASSGVHMRTRCTRGGVCGVCVVVVVAHHRYVEPTHLLHLHYNPVQPDPLPQKTVGACWLFSLEHTMLPQRKTTLFFHAPGR